jgi:hypothetical protein
MKYLWILFATILLALDSWALPHQADTTDYSRHNKKVLCMYNFIIETADGTHYFSDYLYGRLQYEYTQGGHKTYAVDFSEGLDLLPNVDRQLNWGVQLDVNPANCKETK